MSTKATKRNLPVKTEAKKSKKTSKKQVKTKPRSETNEILDGKYSTSKGTNTTTNNISASATAVVEIPVRLDNNAIAAASRACVNYALQRGWNSNDQQGVPGWYFALVRLNFILSAYCSGDQSGNWNSLPRCIVQLGNLLKPKKNLPYYGGRISYNFTDVDPVSLIQYIEGPPSNTGYSTYGVYGNAEPTTGAPVVLPPGGYPGNDATTDQALQAMFSYCQSVCRTEKERRFWAMIPANEELENWASDPSAYGYVSSIDGGVNHAVGGYATVIRSELPCHRPLFSGFAYNGAGYEFARYPGWQHPFSGNVLSNMGLYFTQTIHGRALKMKRAPVYKTIDIEEFIDVLAQYVTELLTKQVNDPIVTNSSSVQACPLNYYQLRYMLRYDMMYMFANSQPFVSSLYPQAVSNGHFDYTALQVGTGLFSTFASTARYPEFFIENMRALTQRVMFNSNAGALNPVVYIPVLSIASAAQPSWKDYVYSFFNEGNPTINYAFPDPSGFGNPSLLDGSLGSSQISMSDNELVSMFANSWNTWLNQLSTYSCALGNISTDAGPLSLITTSQQASTVLQQKVVIRQDSKGKVPVPTPGEIARAKLRKLANVPPMWEEYSVISITSFSPILDAVTPILYSFVLPIAYLVDGNTDPETHKIGTEQGRTKEMSRITQLGQWGGGLTYSTLGRKHKTFVDYMVKAREAEKSTMEELFLVASKSGFGGILSNMLGNLIKGILPKEASPIVDTIAGIVPI